MTCIAVPTQLALALLLSLQQPTAPPTAGTFRVVTDDEPSGMEKYEVKGGPGGYTINSTGEFTAGGGQKKITTTSEIKNGRLSRYVAEITQNGRTQRYTVEFAGGRAKALLEFGERRAERTVEVSADVVPLDRNVWHHYGLLLAGYDVRQKGVQEFRVFIAQAGLREFSAGVELKGKASVKVGNEKKNGYRFVIDLAEGFEVVAITDEHKNLLTLEVPAEKTKVIAE